MKTDDVKAGYEAFRAAMAEKGENYPAWDDLSDGCREANRLFAATVTKRLRRRVEVAECLLGQIHGIACQLSDATYTVRFGKPSDAVEAVLRKEAEGDVVFRESHAVGRLLAEKMEAAGFHKRAARIREWADSLSASAPEEGTRE